MDSQEARHAHPWRAVEEFIDLGYQRSRVIMMNECHAGFAASAHGALGSAFCQRRIDSGYAISPWRPSIQQ
jgi:hypothetical protein